MRLFFWTNCAFAMLISGLVCLPALADDANPPGWRGNTATTFQHWHFPGGAGSDPDVFDNANGTPAMSVFGQATDGANWLASHSGADGVWEIIATFDGRLEFAVPNPSACPPLRNAAGQDQKPVLLQVTYFEGTPGPPVIVMTAQDGTPFTTVGNPVEITLPNGYTHQTTTWTGPASAQETVKVYPAGGAGGGGTTYIDQIVIDTHCGPVPPDVPAASEWGLPVMLLLVAAAGAIILGRASRQRVART